MFALYSACVTYLPPRVRVPHPRPQPVVDLDATGQLRRRLHRLEHRRAHDATLLQRFLPTHEVTHRRAQAPGGEEARLRPVRRGGQRARRREIVLSPAGDGTAVFAVRGGGEPELTRDLLLHVRGVVAPRDLLEHQAEQREVVVAVGPSWPWGRPGP